jgi:hypothetical protein
MLISLFKDVEDDRSFHGKEYPLWQILLFTVLAISCNAKTYEDIRTFILENYDKLNAVFHMNWRVRPTPSCIRKILVRTDPEELETAFRRFSEILQSNDDSLNGQKHYCFDGKTLRCSFSGVKKQDAIRVFNVFDAFANLIIAHVPMLSDKNNEIPVFQNLLETLVLKGIIVTADALHCQKKL